MDKRLFNALETCWVIQVQAADGTHILETVRTYDEAVAYVNDWASYDDILPTWQGKYTAIGPMGDRMLINEDLTRFCLCGCGAITENSTFKPGHDMKLKSQFIKNMKANRWHTTYDLTLEQYEWLIARHYIWMRKHIDASSTYGITHLGGTVTGRITNTKANFEEVDRDV